MRLNKPFCKSLMKACLSLLSLGLLGVIAASAQVSQVSELMDHPGTFAKVKIAGDDLFFLPSDQSNEIQQRSLKGILRSSYHTGSVEGLQVRATLDFALDSAGKLHALLIAKGPSQKRPHTIIRKFENQQSHNDVNLAIPMQARHLDIDGQGNYYLLGVENEAYFGANQSKQTVQTSTINLIHKFSPDGKLLSSFFPVPTPQTSEELRRILQSIFTANLVVLPGGEIFLLWDTADRRTANILQVPNELYRIESNGAINNLELQPPSDMARVVGIHKYGPDLVVEWIKFKPAPSGSGHIGLESAELAVLKGNSQLTLQKGLRGKVLAVGIGKCITSIYMRPTGLKLFLNTLPS